MRYVARMAPLLVSAVILVQGPATLPVGAFKIVPGESKVEFVMRDNRGGFTGVTDQVDGTLSVQRADGDAYEGTVEARVDARRLTTGNGIRDGQMRQNFLETEAHPFITFRGAVSGREGGAGIERGRLRGTLTIRTASRDIDMPFEASVAGDGYRASGEVVVRLSDYGIPIPRFFIFRAEDPVTVKLQVRVRR